MINKVQYNQQKHIIKHWDKPLINNVIIVPAKHQYDLTRIQKLLHLDSHI